MYDVDISISPNDILFVLSYDPKRSETMNKEAFVIKMFSFKRQESINLANLARKFGYFSLSEMNIVSINPKINTDLICVNGETSEHESTGCTLSYVEIGRKNFLDRIRLIGAESFFTFNINTLFILRNGNYLDILKLFSNIEGLPAEIFKGGGQKSHVLSSLEIKLSMYILALSDFNYSKVYYNNAYGNLDKLKYLPNSSHSKKKVNSLNISYHL